MLGLDFGVWLALMLSLASAVLCVGYGMIRWNVDDDSDSDPSARDRPTVERAQEIEEGREEV